MITDDIVIFGGGAVKALTRDRLAGFIALFTDASNVDRHNEYFHVGTDFDEEDRIALPTFYNHRLGPLKRKLGRAVLRRDTQGIYAEAKLSPWDADAERIAHLAAQNELAWSSGSAAHLVVKSHVGKGIKRIDYWPLAEASVLPVHQAAESRNTVSLKSLMQEQNPLLSNEQRGLNACADFERIRFESMAKEFERSLQADSKAEEHKFYAALARLNSQR